MSDALGKVMSKPRIYLYSDYRQFLQDYFDYVQAKNPKFSHRSFAKKASIPTSNYLGRILQRKRSIGKKILPNIVAALDLDAKEKEYFTFLVLAELASSQATKNKYIQAMEQLRTRKDRQLIKERAERYLGHWLYPILREIAQLPGFRPDPYWIAQRLHPSVTAVEIMEALQFLLEEGYLIKDGEAYQAGGGLLYTTDDSFSLTVQRYHTLMMDLAKQLQPTLSLAEREFGSLTLKVPQATLPLVKTKIRAFREDMIELINDAAEEADPATVIQLNIQMFPVFKVKGSSHL